MTMRRYLILLLLISAVFALDRNYYTDEIKLVNHCLPSHIGKFGETGTPNDGWFNTLENCKGKGVLKTLWGTTLAENITIYTTDSDSRLSGVLKNDGFTTFPKTSSGKYALSDANKWAAGMVEVMATALDGRVMVTANNNCISIQAKEIRDVTRNAINMYHFYFPYIHAQENTNGWCFVEP